MFFVIAQAVLPYLTSSMDEENATLVYKSFLPVAQSYADAVEEGDAAELCNIDFSLAYGGKILLHNTRLRLLAGHRYYILRPRFLHDQNWRYVVSVQCGLSVVSCRAFWGYVCIKYIWPTA